MLWCLYNQIVSVLYVSEDRNTEDIKSADYEGHLYTLIVKGWFVHV